MNEFESYEYVIKPKKDSKNTMKRLLLIVLYFLFIVGWLFFGLLTKIFVPLLAFIPITTWLLVFATWRFVNVEYEYTVESGMITFTKIYGGKSRKRILELDIRDAESILPLREKATQIALDAFDPGREYFFAASEDDEDSYVALCIDEDGNRLSVAFTCDERLYRIIKYRNASAFQKKEGTAH